MDRRRRNEQISWECERMDRQSWLVFWIVTCSLLGLGAVFGHVATRWVLHNEKCVEDQK